MDKILSFYLKVCFSAIFVPHLSTIVPELAPGIHLYGFIFTVLF